MTAGWQEDAALEAWAAKLREKIGYAASAESDVEADLGNVKQQANKRPRKKEVGPITPQASGSDLVISVSNEGDNTVVTLRGELDVYTTPRLRQTLISLVNNGHVRLIIDLHQVAFLDSGGLGVLVGGLKRTRAYGGGLLLVGAEERIRKIFRITGVNQALPIIGSVLEACAVMDTLMEGLAEIAKQLPPDD